MSDLSERLRAEARNMGDLANLYDLNVVTLLREAADALDAAEKAIARVASGEAFTTSFFIADSREGDELKARMAFAQAELRKMASPTQRDEGE